MKQILQHITKGCFLFLLVLFSISAFGQGIKGTDFWLALPQVQGASLSENNCAPPYTFRVFIISEYCVENTATIEFCNSTETYSIEAGQYTEIEYGVKQMENMGCLFNQSRLYGNEVSLHIKSDYPVFAKILMDAERLSFGETLIPESMLGTEYIMSFKTNGSNFGGGAGDVSNVIVATEDDTELILNGWDGNGFPNTAKDQQTATLMKGEVYVWNQGWDASNDFPGATATSTSTAQVLSNKPVAVYSYVRGQTSCGNGEEIFTTYLPVSGWGTKYATTQFVQRNSMSSGTCNGYKGSGDWLEVTGKIGTEVTFKTSRNTYTETIVSRGNDYGIDGDYGYGVIHYELASTGADIVGLVNVAIDASGPIQVVQTVMGRQIDNRDNGGGGGCSTNNPEQVYIDAEIFCLFPENLWSSDYYFFPTSLKNLSLRSEFENQNNPNPIVSCYIIRDVPTGGGAQPISTVTIDGVVPPAGAWQNVDAAGEYKYYILQSPPEEALYAFSTEGYPFGIFYYAKTPNNSAIFTGGYGALSPITLCEQCADVDIFTGDNVCKDVPTTFESRLLTARVPDGLKYFWDFGNGTTSTLKNPTVTFDTVGRYPISVVVYNADSSCVVTDTKPFNVDFLTTEVLPVQDSICRGDSVKLIATNNFFPKGDIVIRYSNIQPQDIPDNNPGSPAMQQINIPESFGVSIDLDSICFSIKHPRPEDLKIDLISPGGLCGGQVNIITNRPTTGRANFRKTCIYPSASSSIDAAAPPYTGTYKPQSGSWAGTCDPIGTWALQVGDNKKDARGQILEFSLYFTAPNKVVESYWSPGNLVGDSLATTTFAYPEQTEPFVYTIRNYNKCFGTDTSFITVPRDPIEIDLRDTVVCTSTNPLDLFNLLPAGTDLTGSWVATTGSATIFGGSVIEPQNLAPGEYEFEYNLPIFCGADFGVVKVTINQLPNLGEDSTFAVCNTSGIVDLAARLGGTPDAGGFWSANTSVGFNATAATYNPQVNTVADTFSFKYFKPILGCPIDTAYVNIAINKQLYPGLDGTDVLCEQDTNLVLFDLLSGKKDTGGTWIDLDLTGRLIDGMLNPKLLNGGVYNFQYFIKAETGCADTSAFVEVTVNAIPTADIDLDFDKVCRDSNTVVTVTAHGTGPLTFQLTNGKGFVGTYSVPDGGSISYSELQDSTTQYYLLSLKDNSTPQCVMRVSDTATVQVVLPIVATLIDEVCVSDNSNFRAVVQLSGGEPSSYQEGPNPVNQNPYFSQYIPTSTFYTLTFTDGSNCPLSQAVVEDFKSCRCEIDPGFMRPEVVQYCEGDTAVANIAAQPFLFDAQDTLVYFLHDKSGKTIGDTIAVSATPKFTFQYGRMNFGQTYYISAVVSNKDVSNSYGLDLSDTCYDVSRGSPIIFNALPVISQFPSDRVLCKGSETEVYFDLVGTEEYSIYLTDDAGKKYTFSGLADSAIFTLNPKDTLIYTVDSISDGNAPTCAIYPNRDFTVNVVDLPTAQLSGGGIICESDNLELRINLTGYGNYKVNYQRDGILQPEIATNSTFVTRTITEEGEYSLISVSDRYCKGIVVGDPVTLTVSKKPFANAGTDAIACGYYTELKAIPSHGTGRWTGNGVFSNPFDPETSVTVADYGTYTFTWTESNDPCVSSSDIVEVKFIENPRPNAGNDTVLCVREHVLSAKASKFSGNWFYLGEDSVVFRNPSQPNGSFKVPGPGVYELIWKETSGDICSAVDTVVIRVFDPPKLEVLKTNCNDVAEGFVLTLKATAGDRATYRLNGEPIEDTIIYTEEIPTGTTYTYILSDESSCKADTVIKKQDCDCITQAGTVRSIDTLVVCGKSSFQMPYNYDHILDPNDTLRFIMHTEPYPAIGSIIKTQSSNIFINPLNGNDTRVYYITAVAANKIGQYPNVKLDDRCVGATASVPVRFVENSFVDMQDKISFCANDEHFVPVNFTGEGRFQMGFRIDGGSITNINVVDKAIQIPVNLPVGSHIFEIVSFADQGKGGVCSTIKRKFMEVEIRPQPNKGTLNLDRLICVSDLANFSITGTNAANIIWTLNNETIDLDSFNRRFSAVGTYAISVDLYGSNGCNLLKAYTDSFKVGAPLVPEIAITGLNRKGVACAPANLIFNDNTVYTTTVDNQWQVSGGITATNQRQVNGAFESRGQDTVLLTVTNEFGCVSSVEKHFNVILPDAQIKMNDTLYCQFDKAIFSIDSAIQTNSYTWQIQGSDTGSVGTNLIIQKLQNNGATTMNVAAILTSKEGCKATIDTVVEFVKVTADFTIDGSSSDSVYVCPGTMVNFKDQSANAGSYYWNLANGTIVDSINPAPKNFYVIGSNHVWLEVTDTLTGCSNRKDKVVMVRIPPSIDAKRKYEVCLDNEITLTATGQNLVWRPATALSDTLGETVIMTPVKGGLQRYTVTAVDQFSCTRTVPVEVSVIDIPVPIFKDVDTTVVIGDMVDINLPTNFAYVYDWKPSTGLSCRTCASPTIDASTDREYTVTIFDFENCYDTVTYSVKVSTDLKYSVSLPDAFTPNGDNINPVIYPDGWGIDSILVFHVYNRFGELVHSASGKKWEVAWNGKYNGKLMPAGEYTYKVVATFFKRKEEESITGIFKLLR